MENRKLREEARKRLKYIEAQLGDRRESDIVRPSKEELEHRLRVVELAVGIRGGHDNVR